MADATKHLSINGGTLVSDLKRILSLRTKRTRAFAYAFIFIFMGLTAFLAFNPYPNASSPWFSNIFSSSSITSSTFSGDSSTNTNSRPVPANTTSSSSSSSSSVDGSQFSSVYSYFFRANSSQPIQSTTPRSQNTTFEAPSINKDPLIVKNQRKGLHDKVGGSTPNQTTIGSPKSSTIANHSTIRSPESSTIANHSTIWSLESSPIANQTTIRSPESSTIANQTTIGTSAPKSASNASGDGERKGIAEKGLAKNMTSALVEKKQSNGTNSLMVKQGIENLMKKLVNCNLFDGDWVRDESYPLYKPGSCSLIDEQFNCFANGRPDKRFQQLKWKPNSCTLPRLNGTHMLELLRGKRLVFVGDSLNRNMWESLVCILRNSVKDQSKVYEASGRHHFRTEASYSFVFKDYECTIEFFASPFLVQEWEMKDKNGSKKETLRLDLIGSSANQYGTADIIIFNTGHWWTHDKTAKGKDYYQEGSNVYSELNVLEAFRKAMTTWGRWIDTHINPMRTLLFFRGYSSSHFSGGQWNSGGQCDNEIEPIKNKTYLSPYPDKMTVLEKVLKGMKTKVSYLNITRLTDYRKDGHPSVYRKQHYSEEEKKSPLQFQDCSHWCLPGVPDVWNELLYAELLVKQKQQQQLQIKT